MEKDVTKLIDSELITILLAPTEESYAFVRTLQDQHTKKIPDTVTFECELSAPQLAVDWYKNGRLVKRSDKYDIACKGCVHTLTINDADGRDAGEYSVHFQKIHSEAKLTIEGIHLYI